MKIKVRVEEEVFEVEVGDLHTRPVIATVDGETFELWPEMEPAAAPKVTSTPGVQPTPTATTPPAGAAKPQGSESPAGAVCAPIPGVITRIGVEPGATVARGDELCALEAMKMNNSIRAPKAGKIAAVRVSVGLHVKHGDVLVEYD
jgi:glutaconyl-CoA/methylmalonyl-CoA decarboxylase subunit gamma